MVFVKRVRGPYFFICVLQEDFPMETKPTYQDLEREVVELRKEAEKRLQAEEALRKSEKKFKLLYEQAPLGYQSLDKNGCFLEVNQAWLDTLGYTREEVIGKSFADLLHEDWVEHFNRNFPRFREIGEILGVEFEMRKKNGSFITVVFNGKIGRDANGEMKQTHCILYDITGPKKYETALRDRERMLNETEMLAKVGGWEYQVAEKKFTWKDEVYRIDGVDKESHDLANICYDVSFYAPEDRKNH